MALAPGPSATIFFLPVFLPRPLHMLLGLLAATASVFSAIDRISGGTHRVDVVGLIPKIRQGFTRILPAFDLRLSLT